MLSLAIPLATRIHESPVHATAEENLATPPLDYAKASSILMPTFCCKETAFIYVFPRSSWKATILGTPP
jgi:hypothetical protein